MARSKQPEATIGKILEVSKRLFLKKGFDETTIQDIVDNLDRLTRGAIYHHFKSKEEILKAMSDRMALENIPLEAIKGRNDLNGLQKIQEVLVLFQANEELESTISQTIPLYKNPRVMAAILEARQRILTPLWRELIEDAKSDGSIQTDYEVELSNLLPTLNIMLGQTMETVNPCVLRNKFFFTIEMLSKMGLPVLNNNLKLLVEQLLADIPNKDE